MYSHLQEGAVEPGAAGDAAAPIESPAIAANGASAEAHAEDTTASVARKSTTLAALKAEIARAMQGAADRERERIDAEMGEEETAHVEKIYGRAAAEAAELSKHADEDVALVNVWYKDEVKRVRAEADRQIEERRTGLEQSLTHHGSLIEAEIESVHVAIQDYRASLGEFFGRMAEERDPSAIARLAGDLPDPPDLDEVRAEARSVAMQALEQEPAADAPEEPPENPEQPGTGSGLQREPVAVMDPDAVGQGAGTPSLTTDPVAALVPSAPAADEPSSSPAASDIQGAASAPEAASSQGNVAVRVIRTITNWSSAAGVSEDR